MTLYDRIGGAPAVQLAVEHFFVRVLADAELGPFFAKSGVEHLKRHQFAFLSQVMGGPKTYTGATMAKAHSHLRIEERHFNAVAGHLVATLKSLNVSEDMIAEVVAALTPLAADVVNTKAAG